MLKEHIEQSGQTQRQFAQAAGISEGYLSLILAGSKVPSLAVAARIERLTNGKVSAASLAETDNKARGAA